jgi:GT2 family glycosyltransferase
MHSTKRDITISLVSYNQRKDLERLLPMLVQLAPLSEVEILLVDNRSVDGTTTFVKEAFPQIQVFYNPRRSGYGENHNLNLQKASGRYFVIMNSDMMVETDIFSSLRDYMDQHLDLGIVSPMVLNEDRKIQGLNKRYPTVFDLFLRRFVPGPIQKLCQRRLDYYEMRDIGYEHRYDVPFMSGAFMFCRTDLLQSLGGFDPKFFLYFEDVDLCRRVQQTHRTEYYPEVSVIHFWQRASHKNWMHTLYFIKSTLRYFRKWGIRFY